jgi:ATP-dependent RNA helicase SUPV3L1/SUV3
MPAPKRVLEAWTKMASELEARIRNVTAVLGPTNTGKTHLAIERMLGHDTGMIGLPLRLLAREVYDRCVAKVGADKVALITGEEKIKPESARFWVCTVEAMPREVSVDFLAIDEIQLASDPERGHVFTDRLLHARGKLETLMLGSQTMREAIGDLIPGANFISRPRLSKLTYSGQKKITRLPTRSAIVTFSANDVYAVAELIRRQRGGAAVVLGALSPRTRNAQVALYQSGDVDFLVATDAVGMGLNLDVDHVAFAAIRKFDGQNHRNLTPSEIGQIAGRAGRHMNDGTFGVTGSVEPFDNELVERLETHTFDSVKVLQWRNRTLDFGTLDRLRDSLREMPREQRLTRARMADDVLALENVSHDREVLAMATSPASVTRLWEVCQVPDYRKISSQNHAEMVGSVYKFLMGPDGRIPEDWFAKQVAFADRTDGDIDTLANRIAHIRTWTFVSNRPDWLQDPEHWQGRTRQIEDALSDALHERLTQRFVDRRTSALMRGMRDKDELNAEIGEDGAIKVEDHYVGRLKGFRFWPDAQADGIHGKAARTAAAHVVSKELGMRSRRVAAAKNDAFKLTRSGRVLWREEEIAKLDIADDPLKPSVTLLVDEHMSGPDKEKVQARLETWITDTIADRLKPLVEIGKAEDVTGLARGIAFRLTESYGVLKRDTVASEIKSLDQEARSQLRKYGVRFGAFNIYFPVLLKPAPADLTLTLWSLKHAAAHGLDLDQLPQPPRPGLTSAATDPATPEPFYRAFGFHVCGPRAVRIDILERLADLIRPLVSWRAPADATATPPKGATGDGGFTVTPEMMSILGCSPDELGNVLKTLGFRMERRPVRKRPSTTAAAEPAPVSETTPSDATISDAGAGAATEPQSETSEATPALDGAPVQAPTAVMEPATEDASSPGETADGVSPSDAPVVADVAVAATAEGQVEPGVPDAAAATAEPGSDNATPDGDAASTGTADAASEPEMEEVWRPRRHRDERPRRHDRHGQRHGERSRGGDRGRGRGPRDRHDAPGVAASADVSPAGEGAVAAAPAHAHAGAAADAPQGRADHPRERDRREHRDRDRDRQPSGERRGERERGDRDRRHGHGHGPGGGRGRDERGPRRDDRDRRREDRPPQVRSASPAKKGGPDPDSPFAALSSLKQALERQTTEPKS